MTPTTIPTTKTTKTTMTIKEFLGSLETFRLLTLLVLLIFVSPVLSGYTWGQPSRDSKNLDEAKENPEFQVATSSITALVGKPVYLPCRVRNLGDRVVSWIRTRDLHILTSGTLTYTSDSRFEVLHNPGSEMWTLRIMSVQPRDQGKYECQVNTDPKINFAIQLTVRETDMQDEPYIGPMAAANIEGPKEQYVSRASTVTFTCMIMSPYTHPNKPPRVVDWFHSDRLVTIQAERGGISIETVKTDVHTKSTLTVAGVTYRDGGNYTCRPTDTQPASVQLIVLEGEHTEAMQRDGDPSNAPRPSLLSLGYQLILGIGLSVYHLSDIT